MAGVLREFRTLVGDAARAYSRHGGRMLAAAVAFSSLLSIAPLLFIALAIASFAVGDAGHQSVMDDLSRWIGDDGARTIGALLEHTEHPAQVTIAYAAILVYASTRLFSQIKRALNHLWNVQAKSGAGVQGKAWKQIRKRGTALLLVALVGGLVVAVVVVKTLLAASDSAVLLWIGESVMSLATTTVMFAVLFKVLPDAVIHWRDALRGAFVTAILFALGTTLISLYLGHKTLDVLYGPGGSIVLLLLWVHYSAQVFFFGAALTGELARRGGRPIVPDEHGIAVVAIAALE